MSKTTKPISSLTYHPSKPPRGWRWLKSGEKIRASDAYHYCSDTRICKVCSDEVGNMMTHAVFSRSGAIGQYIRRIVKRRKPKG